MPGCTLLMALTMLGAAGGCASGTGTAMSVAPGEDLRLQVGQSVTVEGRALKIGFEGVEADSRCPKGEACVWEGDAIVLITVQSTAGTGEERELHTSSKGPATADYDGWSIRLVALEPYPVTGRTIPPAAYVLTLQVVRGSTAASEIQ